MDKEKLKTLLKSKVMLLILIFLIVVFGIMSPNFLSIKNIMNICTQNAYLIITAIGVAMIMISGGTDLSIGQIISVIGVCVAIFMQDVGMPVPAAIAAGLIVGGVMGCFNGFAANLLKIHPMIVTLATMTVYEGVSYTISGSKSFYNFPDSYTSIGQGYVGVVSNPVIIAIAIAIIAHFILEKTCFGRFIYASGGGAEAARLAGINIKKSD